MRKKIQDTAGTNGRRWHIPKYIHSLVYIDIYLLLCSESRFAIHQDHMEDETAGL